MRRVKSRFCKSYKLWLYWILEMCSFSPSLTLGKLFFLLTTSVFQCFLTWLLIQPLNQILFNINTCRARSQKSMNHENDESSAHRSDVKCHYQAQFDNRIFTCRVRCKEYLIRHTFPSSWHSQTLGVLAAGFLFYAHYLSL